MGWGVREYNTGAKQAHRDEKFKERSDAKWNKRNITSGQKSTQLILQHKKESLCGKGNHQVKAYANVSHGRDQGLGQAEELHTLATLLWFDQGYRKEIVEYSSAIRESR